VKILIVIDTRVVYTQQGVSRDCLIVNAQPDNSINNNGNW
jgi:hypothetical protein